MDQQRSTFIAIGLIFIVLALIAGTIYYLVGFVRSRQRSTPLPSPSAQVQDISNPTPTGNPNFPNATQQPSQPQQGAATAPRTATPPPRPVASADPNMKVHNQEGLQVQFPETWGLLTCNNSVNFELDPTNATDVPNYPCDYAVKPVTVMVYEQQISCPGTSTNVGNVQVTKSKTTSGNVTTYRWCTRTAPSLDITHRVSAITSPASSRTDYSQQVEQMISKILTSSGS